jgi:3-hydroxyisobutyrate dehydrogenase
MEHTLGRRDGLPDGSSGELPVTRIRDIGFIGLGRMGLPMAVRLARAGYRVRGFDISERARAAFRGLSREDPDAAFAADDAAGAATAADAVILMLPGSPAIGEVTHDQGLLTAMRPGALLIDMSSADPAATTELAAEADAMNLTLIGAPVSGGISGAKNGTLTIMAGGPASAVRRARPVLATLGARVIHVGEMPGAGHALKALNNLMAAVHLLATSEAMLAGQRFGLDPAVMLDVVNTSTGRSFSTLREWPDYVLPGRYESGFGIDLLLSDALTGLSIQREAGTGTRLAEVAVEMWRRAAHWLPAGADHTELVRWLEHTREGATDR